MENFENVFLSGPYGKEKKRFQFYHYGNNIALKE